MRPLLDYIPPKEVTDFNHNLKDILCDIEFIKKGRKELISNVASVFDIEATSFYDNDEKRATMYAWVFGLNGRCIRGRTWSEFLDTIELLRREYDLSPNKRLIIYVHNLAYEFQWLHKYFKWEKVFAVDKRKPVYAITSEGIEFRCSYLLSGYSLEVLGYNLTKYKVNKLIGNLDYDKLRHSLTPLTKEEWKYILNDGLVVMAHIQEEIERLGSIAELPITKTGYVRKLCREKCLKGDNRFDYARTIRALTLTPDTYLQLKRTYMGGFTHANLNYVDRIIKDVHSFDFTSSYPAVMVAEKYPMSKPFKIDLKDENDFYSRLDAYCCMFDCKFYNIRSTCNFENYISLSRCQEAEHFIVNNGRIVEADIISVSLTEKDFKIIAKMYEWDRIEITNFYCFYADYLPKDFIMTILELYRDKTELKGIEDKIVEYLVSKGMVNALYGMCVTDICKDDIIYTDGIWDSKNADTEALINKYNKSGQRFLYYAWGVWVTAYARYNLFSGILEFGDDYIYSDTDSIKVRNIENHIEYIEKYNEEVTKKIHRCLDEYDIPHKWAKPKTIEGIEKPLGVWDYEGKYERFKTLGAKRYMTEGYNKKGEIEISITIAGVSKKAGIEYLKYTYEDNTKIFDAFTEDMTFPAHYDRGDKDANGSGKLCHTYLDQEMYGFIIDYMGVKWCYHELSGVHMENTEYTLSLEAEFRNMIMGVKAGHIA